MTGLDVVEQTSNLQVALNVLHSASSGQDSRTGYRVSRAKLLSRSEKRHAMEDPQPLSDAEAPRDGQSQPRDLPAPVPTPSHASPQWTTVKYGTEHALQDMMIHVPPRRTTDPPRTLWLVFLHGGGWRDPVQTRADILPAIALLSASPRHAASMSRVAGVASLNYALSADAADASLPAGRGYRHPRHLRDAAAALRKLADLHGVGREGGPGGVGGRGPQLRGDHGAFQLAMGAGRGPVARRGGGAPRSRSWGPRGCTTWAPRRIRRCLRGRSGRIRGSGRGLVRRGMRGG